jgi:hypothetical protein
VLLLLIAVTQWVSFWTFRRRIALQIFCGMASCIAIAALLFHSNYAFTWEHRNYEGLTWRSDVVIFLFLSMTQALSFLAFRWIKLRKQKLSVCG